MWIYVCVCVCVWCFEGTTNTSHCLFLQWFCSVLFTLLLPVSQSNSFQCEYLLRSWVVSRWWLGELANGFGFQSSTLLLLSIALVIFLLTGFDCVCKPFFIVTPRWLDRHHFNRRHLLFRNSFFFSPFPGTKKWTDHPSVCRLNFCPFTSKSTWILFVFFR